MTHKILTSKGEVLGNIEGDAFVPDEAGRTVLRSLFSYESLKVENGWLTVELGDGYYGSPEYPIQTL